MSGFSQALASLLVSQLEHSRQLSDRVLAIQEDLEHNEYVAYNEDLRDKIEKEIELHPTRDLGVGSIHELLREALEQLGPTNAAEAHRAVVEIGLELREDREFNTIEAILLQHMIDVVTATMLPQAAPVTARDLRCPICFKIMADPVVLTASGIKCDLHCLQDRIATGQFMCPTTGKDIRAMPFAVPDQRLWALCQQHLVSTVAGSGENLLGSEQITRAIHLSLSPRRSTPRRGWRCGHRFAGRWTSRLR